MIETSLNLAGKAGVMGALGALLERWTVNQEYYVTATADHAPYVEYGTYKMQAQPYLRPAAQRVGARVGTYAKGVRTGDMAAERVARAVEEEAKRVVPVDTGELRNSITVKAK